MRLLSLVAFLASKVQGHRIVQLVPRWLHISYHALNPSEAESRTRLLLPVTDTRPTRHISLFTPPHPSFFHSPLNSSMLGDRRKKTCTSYLCAGAENWEPPPQLHSGWAYQACLSATST